MLAVRIYSDGYWVYNARTGQHSKFLMLTTLYLWNDNNTTETTFVPSGSTTVASAKSEIEKSRSTVAWSLTSVAWPFSNFFQNVWNVQKNVVWQLGRRSRELRPLSCDRWVTFFRIFPNCLKRLKTLFDSRPTVAWTPITVTWPFSDFFQKFSKLLETCINVVWQSADGRVTSDHCRVTVQRLFSKCYRFAWNVEKTLFDSRPTVAWPPTTNAWPLSNFFKIFLNCRYVGKTLFESQRTVAWLSGYFATVFVSYGFTYAIAYVIYLVFDLTFAGGTPTLKFVTWWYNEK